MREILKETCPSSCPTCGTSVRLYSSGEGTHCYEPVPDLRAIDEVIAGLDLMLLETMNSAERWSVDRALKYVKEVREKYSKGNGA